MFKGKKNNAESGQQMSPLKQAFANASAMKQPPAPTPNATGNSAKTAAGDDASVSGGEISQVNGTTGNQLGGSGLLLIRVMEARNLILPNGSPVAIGSSTGADVTRLPYILMDFDKNEVVITAREGNANTKTVSWQHRAHFDVSRAAEVTISVFQRNTQQGDLLLGSVQIRPIFVDGKIQDQWFSLQNPDAVSQTSSFGEIHMQLVFRKSGSTKPLSIDDFELLKVIGKGSFGKVMQVRKKDTNRIYAMKIIRKAHIVERAEVSHTLAERAVLAKINHSFIVPLKFSFQSPDKLYLVMGFVNGGELFHHLQREGRFEESRAKFYAAELLCALECLHGYNIIYRDLKPENILLDYTGHIALCDFGLCKLNMKDGNKTNTFCGTPEYLAPELLMGLGYTKVVDWWTIGILLYEMLTGLPPFYDENTNEMYKKILTDELQFPEEVNPTAKDLLQQLLNREPSQRLGADGADDIKRHPFFADINWARLIERKYPPPFRPNVSSATDTSNFDVEFTSEAPTDSLPDSSGHLSSTVQQQFAGFSYQAHEAIAGSVANGVGSLIAPAKGIGSVVGSFRAAGPQARNSGGRF